MVKGPTKTNKQSVVNGNFILSCRWQAIWQNCSYKLDAGRQSLPIRIKYIGSNSSPVTSKNGLFCICHNDPPFALCWQETPQRVHNYPNICSHMPTHVCLDMNTQDTEEGENQHVYKTNSHIHGSQHLQRLSSLQTIHTGCWSQAQGKKKKNSKKKKTKQTNTTGFLNP